MKPQGAEIATIPRGPKLPQVPGLLADPGAELKSGPLMGPEWVQDGLGGTHRGPFELTSRILKTFSVKLHGPLQGGQDGPVQIEVAEELEI